MRKVFKDRTRIAHTSKERYGSDTGLIDKFGFRILVGDMYQFNEAYSGIVLYNSSAKEYQLMFGKWYGDNPYDYKSYGKSISLRNDNGMSKHLVPMNDMDPYSQF